MSGSLVQRLQRISQHSFSAFISSAEFALVKVGSVLDLHFPDVVAKYFDGEYPGRFAYGTLDQSEVLWAFWWKKHFGSLHGVLRDDSATPGLYLFHLSKVAAFHPAQVEPPAIDEGAVVRTAVRIFADLYLGTKLTTRALDDHIADSMRPAIQFLDGVVQKLIRSQGAGPETRARSQHRDPVQPAVEAEKDPYEVIGVPRSATNDEVKRAFREKIARNHPDKVQHMSREFQDLADKRMKSITAAFEKIKQLRGDFDAAPAPSAPAPGESSAGSPDSSRHENGSKEAGKDDASQQSNTASQRRRSPARKKSGSGANGQKKLPVSSSSRNKTART